LPPPPLGTLPALEACAAKGIHHAIVISAGFKEVGGEGAALGYFQRIHNQAVITGGHRADIQLAALETSTHCLVLTGDQTPNQIIIARARDAGVPIIVASYDTLTTVEKLEAVLGRIRIREAPKVKRAQEFMRDRLNYRHIIQKLDVK